jgi:hypothetical protein
MQMGNFKKIKYQKRRKKTKSALLVANSNPYITTCLNIQQLIVSRTYLNNTTNSLAISYSLCF